jgi:hypothetical protein
MAKRNQLVKGQEWAYQRSRSHYIGDWFTKVIIEEVEPYEKGYNGPRKSGSGSGVWIKSAEARYVPSVIQLSQLFIPWSEYEVQRAEYEAKKKISDAESAIRNAERKKYQEEVFAPAVKEFQRVVQDGTGKWVSSWDVEKFPIEVIQFVIESAKKKEEVSA